MLYLKQIQVFQAIHKKTHTTYVTHITRIPTYITHIVYISHILKLIFKHIKKPIYL